MKRSIKSQKQKVNGSNVRPELLSRCVRKVLFHYDLSFIIAVEKSVKSHRFNCVVEAMHACLSGSSL